MSPHSSELAGKSHGHRRLAGCGPWGSSGVGRYEPLAPTKPVPGVGCSTSSLRPRLEKRPGSAAEPRAGPPGIAPHPSGYDTAEVLFVLLSVKYSLSVPQKWRKQLSRLQRTLVLFLLVVLMLFGLLSYVHVADEWAGTSCMILRCP